MLQYLMADYLDFALRRRTTLFPVYITCSSELLDRARKSVRGLLTAHHKRLLDGAHDVTKVEEIVSRSFVVFREFLYSLLKPTDQPEFVRDRFVNYARFRRLWEDDFARRPEAKKLTPDIAWHAIRSYIKGIRSTRDDDLDPDEFAALPRRRRSVSVETYRVIYERVWCSWYKRLCEDGYWDEQDLAAWVLSNGRARSVEFAAVFCDEAQDFTPIELEIIFQLSVYSKRSLQPEELRLVPIVFAGDPLQTINPTGFQWEAVQSNFHDRFCAVLDPRRRVKVPLSYRELKFNYRSNPGIVRFCNLIQLLRAALLGRTDVAPQEAWWVEEEVPPVWFSIDAPLTRAQLQQRTDFVKLVNCEEGEESEYARSDSTLAAIEERSEGVFRNVLGPAKAKGLEFPAVVIYRFAETAPGDFLGLLTGELKIQDDPEAQLPFEYFFNRLYVAASRAKRQLFVIDDEETFRTFWRFATDPEFLERLTHSVRNPEPWRNSLACLVQGVDASWTGERIDPREQGDEYAAQGRRKKDSYLLRQAALAYRSARDEIEAGRCLALAAEFEGKLADAGDRYRALGFLEDAFRCYWEGGQFKSVCEVAGKSRLLATRLESRASEFMTEKSQISESLLFEIQHTAGDLVWLKDVAKNDTWTKVFLALAERLAKGQGCSGYPLQSLYPVFKKLREEGLAVPELQMALLAYGAGEYLDAVDLWERVGATDRDDYRRAKGFVTGFPENLIWFYRAKEYRRVLEEWRLNGSRTALRYVDDSIVHAVVDAALECGELKTGVEVLSVRPDRQRVGAVLAAAARKAEGSTAVDTALLAIRIFMSTKSWEELALALGEADFSGLVGEAEGSIVQQFLRSENRAKKILETTVEELARAFDLVRGSADASGTMGEFLSRAFLEGKNFEGLEVSPEVVGAAIERVGRIVDAIRFYEALYIDRQRPANVRKFAVERLVKNLELYADYFRERNDEIRASEREERAKRLRRIADIGERSLPEYPSLPPKSVKHTPREWIRGPFKFVLSLAHSRLRIEQTERFETVTIDLRLRELRGDAQFFVILGDGRGLTSWKIPEWNLKIELTPLESGVNIVAFGGTGGEERLFDETVNGVEVFL